ncbi:MAG: O-acetyl-ADP-ribose deacetylase [Candidatus Thermoplasmatota archaeon]
MEDKMNREDKVKRKKIEDSVLEIAQGDITAQDTEAVVNAANKRLAPGGGVAGAIHNAAGPELYEECKQLGRLETGEAVITDGYELPADHVIHTVGPVYSKKGENERLLRNSYRNSLETAAEKGVESIAFPAISTGAFGYPTEEAAQIALDEIKRFLEKNNDIEQVRMVLYSEEDYKTHAEIIEDISD